VKNLIVSNVVLVNLIYNHNIYINIKYIYFNEENEKKLFEIKTTMRIVFAKDISKEIFLSTRCRYWSVLHFTFY